MRPLLLLPQQVSICVNNFEIYHYTDESHYIVGDAFTKRIHGVPPLLTAKDVIVSRKRRAKLSAVLLVVSLGFIQQNNL